MTDTARKLALGLVMAAGFAGLAHAGPQKDHDVHAGHDMRSAKDPHAAHKAQMSDEKGNKVTAADVTLPDTVMLDQTGAERTMASDVVGDRIVVVDFIFTSCTTICPVTTALMAQAHGKLADISEDDLAFVSMSIDANTDTPQRLAEFAARAKADWTFLTGERRVMDKALTDMDAYSTNPEDHAPMIIIGDASTGEFIRVFGLPNPAMIEARVREFADARKASADAHAHHH
ncbi:MAG: SCO family protein [Henriciella sp.]